MRLKEENAVLRRENEELRRQGTAGSRGRGKEGGASRKRKASVPQDPHVTEEVDVTRKGDMEAELEDVMAESSEEEAEEAVVAEVAEAVAGSPFHEEEVDPREASLSVAMEEAEEGVPAQSEPPGEDARPTQGDSSDLLAGSDPTAVARALYLMLSDTELSWTSTGEPGETSLAPLRAASVKLQRRVAKGGSRFVLCVIERLCSRAISSICRRGKAPPLCPFESESASEKSPVKDFFTAYFLTVYAAKLVSNIPNILYPCACLTYSRASGSLVKNL